MRESDFLAQNITIPNFMDSWLANSREKKAHPDWLRLNGILCFCGEQGSGKTLSAVQYVRNVCHMYPRMKVISNIELFFPISLNSLAKVTHELILSSIKVLNSEEGNFVYGLS